MPSAIFVLLRHWLALAAVLVLVAVALAAGTLFAANERQQQPELPTTDQQSVVDATNPVPVVEPPLVPPDPERVLFQTDDEQVEVGLPPIDKEPPRYPNLDSNLNRLAEQAQAAGPTATEQQASGTDGGGTGDTGSNDTAPMPGPVLVTFYIHPEHIAAVRQFLEKNDVFIRNVGEDYIEAHVPPALLPAASQRLGVRRVDTVIPPEPQSLGSVVSQGVELHQADAWHDMGYRGQGVKVGIIDLGFEGFSRRQGGELPRSATARCYFQEARPPSSRLADCEVGSDHGTAVAETLVDVAPEVELYIAQPRSSGDLRDTVDWMVENGVHVINHSQTWGYEGPGDGTSYFSSGVIRSIDAAVSGGIVFVNSAGNSAKVAWYGAFRDPDGNNWHNFNTRFSAVNYFPLWFSEDEGRDIFAQMRWDDEWGGADCNLDLHLAKSVPGEGYNTIVADIDVQDGGDSDIPRAWVRFEVPSVAAEGLYALAIRKLNCADEPDWIQLEAWEIPELGYYSPGHHIGNPEESRNPGMLAVDATHWSSPQVIASYSSRGPTIDGRIKPDITGIACGRSTVVPPGTEDGTECWFSGTSQAAPHVAGLAALVKQRFPDYSPAEVVRYLEQNAVDRGSTGGDNTWGHGLAALPMAQTSTPTPVPPTPTPTPTPVPSSPPTGNISLRDGINPGEVVVSWDAVDEATYYRIGYVNMVTDYPLAKASNTGEWLEAFVYVDVNAFNFTERGGRVEYTVRRLAPGVRHAFTVLTSNEVENTKEYFSGRYSWPGNPRWSFHTTAP